MRARRSIAVMLAEEQLHVTTVDPHEQRCVLLETGLELDRESEIVEVEFARLRLIKHPQNWNGLIKFHRNRSHDGFIMLWLVRIRLRFGAKLTTSCRNIVAHRVADGARKPPLAQNRLKALHL